MKRYLNEKCSEITSLCDPSRPVALIKEPPDTCSQISPALRARVSIFNRIPKLLIYSVCGSKKVLKWKCEKMHEIRQVINLLFLLYNLNREYEVLHRNGIMFAYKKCISVYVSFISVGR